MNPLRSIPRLILKALRALANFTWNSLSIVLVLSLAATIPVVQFASLGYMLECSARIANRQPLRSCFPGIALAGHIVRCGIWTLLTWLPIWLITDLGYSSELIQPGSNRALYLRIAARILAILWVLWVVSAILRGGRWFHFLWPRPIRFAKTLFSGSFWLHAENRWWDFLKQLHLWRLIRLGFKASLGAGIWLAFPALLILLALNAAPEVKPEQQGGLALLGLLGAILMAWAIQYLPTLQTYMARNDLLARQSTENPQFPKERLGGVLNRSAARTAFRRTPLRFVLANTLFLALALPLYLLRIEEIPPQLWFLLSIFFVVLMFPAKLLVGWALRCSLGKTKDAHWTLRWLAWVPWIAAIGVYVGFLYLGKFALWEGGAILLFQHAFLPPVPFYLR